MWQKSPAEEVHTGRARVEGITSSWISGKWHHTPRGQSLNYHASRNLHGKARCQSPSHDFTLLHLSFASLNSSIVSFKLHCTFTSLPAHSRSHPRVNMRDTLTTSPPSESPAASPAPPAIELDSNSSRDSNHNASSERPINELGSLPNGNASAMGAHAPEHPLLIRPYCPNSHTPSATISEALP